ncbi:MAG: sigma 54-interacting transcriptional regulator [Candidatus Omnitrophica bacterium]|nr:sigma 54-interacting transcriptional regulator [Candidatus Omnitrophota bacterium]
MPSNIPKEGILNLVFNSITEGIVVCDAEMKITEFNRAAEDITGYSKKEAIGKRCTDIFKGRLCGERCAVCETMKTSHPASDYQARILRKDGTARMVVLNTSVLKGPGRPRGVIIVFKDVTELMTLRQELGKRDRFFQLVGKSRQMQGVYDQIESIAEHDSTALIRGETGVGKELVAQAIHYQSPRSHGPFVKVNCSVLSETLLESELFGHVQGAFTGAIRDRVGRFELASSGSIFLDEIGDISPAVQLKLLRVIQDKEIERVGESRLRKVDVRIITATNRNLEKLVKEGKFREDLYYRLKVIPIEIPPLRERKDDIPLLVEHFIERFNTRYKKNVEGVSHDALASLLDYDWKGNVRELENSVEYAFVHTKGNYLEMDSFPAEIKSFRSSPCALSDGDERLKILNALETSRWNKAEAARKLNIDRTTLWRKMKKYGI